MNADPSDHLRNRVMKLRNKTKDKRESIYFYSPKQLAQAIQPADIKACLRYSHPLTGIFDNDRDLTRIADRIALTSLKLFATLLVDKNESHILEFYYRHDDDSRMPRTLDSLHFLSETVRQSFFISQWAFCPVELSPAQNMILDKEAIVPIVNAELCERGSYGKVFKVQFHPDLNPQPGHETPYLALKVMESHIEGAEEDAALKLLRELKDDHIIQYLGSYQFEGGLGEFNLIFPFADGDLRHFMRKERYLGMKIHEIYSSISGLAHAISKIHNFSLEAQGASDAIKRKGCHHDLRPRNILLLHGKFVLADFGLSRLKSLDQDSKTPRRGGDDDYLPPGPRNSDNNRRQVVGRASDCWAFGCILTELATVMEGRSVSDFREVRKVTHTRNGSNDTVHEFHSNGQICEPVRKWLESLETNSSVNLTPRLLRVARQLMRTADGVANSQISEVTTELELLALDAVYFAVEDSFKALSRLARPFLRLEKIRIRTWWCECKRIDGAFIVNHGALAALQSISKILKRYEDTKRVEITTSGLPTDFIAAVDNLCRILPPEHTDISSLWADDVADLYNDKELLNSLTQLPLIDRYREVGLSAAMAEVMLAIERPCNAQNQQRNLNGDCIKLNKTGESAYIMRADTSKETGWYFPEDHQAQEPIFIEWKELSNRWEGRGEDQLNIINSLVNLLDPHITELPETVRTRVPECRGYFFDENTKRFAFVYRLRSSIQDCLPSLLSIHDIIRLTSFDEIDKAVDDKVQSGELNQDDFSNEVRSRCKAAGPPADLGDIFQLAYNLASCLLAVHRAGWLHKNISSHQLLVFATSPNAAYAQDTKHAILTGFNDSRPDILKYTLGPKDGFKYYKHPKYLPDTNFSMPFDYYSLGIVLLELGLWQTMALIGKTDSRLEESSSLRMETLLASYIPMLGHKTGRIYQKVVEFCLTADVAGGISKVDIRKQFRENVVDQLFKCKA